MNDDIRAVELFSGTLWEADLLKSLLENAEIESYLKDDIIGTNFPWHAAGGGANPIKVIVSSQDYDRALAVLQDFKKNQIK
ncbi:MAG: DUF2007 domain-containing protein [Bacteroidales bacterium]|nr:DUF2007 domain-containing protein [Bacteroidales bacterium]